MHDGLLADLKNPTPLAVEIQHDKNRSAEDNGQQPFADRPAMVGDAAGKTHRAQGEDRPAEEQ